MYTSSIAGRDELVQRRATDRQELRCVVDPQQQPALSGFLFVIVHTLDKRISSPERDNELRTSALRSRHNDPTTSHTRCITMLVSPAKPSP
jgi:hypothetical protein